MISQSKSNTYSTLLVQREPMSTSMKKVKRLFYITSLSVCFLICLGGINPAFAQNLEPERKWNFLAEVYLLFPNMTGETGVGNTILVPVDATTSDIFSTLKLGGMLYLEAHTKKWAITSDFVFMNLEKDMTPTTLIQSGTVGIHAFTEGREAEYPDPPF